MVSPAGSLSPSQVPLEPRAKDTKQEDLHTEGPLDNEVNETQTPNRRNKSGRGKNRKGGQLKKHEGEVEVTMIGGEEVSTVVVAEEEELEEEVEKMRIAYSVALLNKSYAALDDFNPRGMEHLYLITNLFLQLVHRDQEMPKELSNYITYYMSLLF